MEGSELFYGALCAATFAGVVLLRFVIGRLWGASAAARFAALLPYAIMAAKWVERAVPDDYGNNAEDPWTVKSLHKLDLFLKKFTELCEKMESIPIDDALRSEAVKWTATLAGRLSSEPMAPIAAGAAMETVLKRVSRADFR